MGTHEKRKVSAWRRTKSHPSGDGAIQVVARVNRNAYKLDLPREYSISATFNVFDFSPFEFDVGSSD